MDILSILDPTSQGLLKLLEFLEAHEGQASKKIICDALAISPKKLRYQIDNILHNYQEDIICDNQLHDLCIKYQKNSSLIVIKHRIFQESTANQLLLSLLTTPQLTYEILENKLYLSTSSVSRYLSKIRTLLHLHNLELKKTNIIGSEQRIRLFYLYYIEEVYSFSAEIFQNIPEVESYINRLTIFIKNHDDYKLSVYTTLRIRRLAYIFYYRSFFENSQKLNYNSSIKVSYPSDMVSLHEYFLENRSELPKQLLSAQELDLLTQICFILPLVHYEGQLYNDFMTHHKLINSPLYKVFNYSRQILSPVFDSVLDSKSLKMFEQMLFCINNTGLLFQMDMEQSNHVVNNLERLGKEKDSLADVFLIKSINKINNFVKSIGLIPFDFRYLHDQYGLLFIRSTFYDVKKSVLVYF